MTIKALHLPAVKRLDPSTIFEPNVRVQCWLGGASERYQSTPVIMLQVRSPVSDLVIVIVGMYVTRPSDHLDRALSLGNG
jgi:hypothetical protein